MMRSLDSICRGVKYHQCLINRQDHCAGTQDMSSWFSHSKKAKVVQALVDIAMDTQLD